MLAAERQQIILETLEGNDFISIEALVQKLEVSAETIRRDFAKLEQQNSLKRVHGGAARTSFTTIEDSYFLRINQATIEKRNIAALAVSLIKPGQTVVIDLGTTALEIAKLLPYDFTGSVATTSLLVAAELSLKPGVELFVPGGKVRPGDLALSGGATVNFFKSFHADIAFLGSGGIDADHLTDYHYDEIFVKQAILEHADSTFALADNSKFSKRAKHTVVPLSELTGIITDRKPEFAAPTTTTGQPLLILHPEEQPGGFEQ